MPENPAPKAVWGAYEFEKIKKSLHSKEDQDLFEFLWLTGARLSSAADARLSDIDMKNRRISFRSSKGPKQSVKTYYFPIYDKLHKFIIELLKRRDNPSISHNYLFTEPSGKPINSKNFTGRVRKVLIRSGLKNNHGDILSLHGLRHSLASRLHEGGLTVNEIKGLLGHSSVTVTEGYIHSDASLLKSKIENIA
jgi:integrase/recombinase XerD